MSERKYSIVMSCYDQANELESNLPSYLTQEYEPGYEVIVVDESSTDRTADVLKLFKNDYAHLYTTFLPKPSASLFRKKFAFNIGAKAANNEWIMFTTISNKLVASDILRAINENLSDDAQLTLGYQTRKGIRLQPFASIEEAEPLFLKGERRLTEVAERKHFKYTLGRYDLIIIRKNDIVDMLRFFEQRIPLFRLLCIRWRIIFENLLRHSSTTLLVTA